MFCNIHDSALCPRRVQLAFFRLSEENANHAYIPNHPLASGISNGDAVCSVSGIQRFFTYSCYRGSIFLFFELGTLTSSSKLLSGSDIYVGTAALPKFSKKQRNVPFKLFQNFNC